MNHKKLGCFIFIILIVAGTGIGMSLRGGNKKKAVKGTVVHGAAGGGKENFLKDEDINRILNERYGIILDADDWSNGKLITEPLVYGEKKKKENYDFVFFSDERFYEYYKTPASGKEAPRLKILDSAIALNTPIVIYSWDTICDILIGEGIVTEREGIYYITDMNKLIEYIKMETTWSDIGAGDIFGRINIASTDPVTSSPGATYYGLLASIMNNGAVDAATISNIMPELKDFYKYSGFMNNTPADLFDLYLRMGKGAYPLVVDYEKSMIEFANRNPQGFEQVKDKIRILYPEPTLWNSHCIMSFSEEGSKYVEALSDPEIQQIAWERYGFRTGIQGGQYDVSKGKVAGIPQELISVARSLKKDVYDLMIEGLKGE